MGRNVKVATRKLEGLRVTLAGLKEDFNLQWSEDDEDSLKGQSSDGSEYGSADKSADKTNGSNGSVNLI